MKAAFIKEGDLFKEKGIRFLDTFVNLSKPDLFERQMFEEFQDILGLTPEENKRAVDQGYRSLNYFDNVTMRGAARDVLDQLEREDRLGVVLLGRPYHNDPGVNHEILEEFQKLGYPVFAQDSLPIDDDMVWRLFGETSSPTPDPPASTTSGRTATAKHQPQVWARSTSRGSEPGGAGALFRVLPRRSIRVEEIVETRHRTSASGISDENKSIRFAWRRSGTS